MERGGARGRPELQWPRTAALKVNARKNKQHQHRKPPPAQVRQPVIIYTVSPKVVHATPTEFMSVVQSLTGAAPSSSTPPPLPSPFHLQAGQHEHKLAATSSSGGATAGVGALPPAQATFSSPPTPMPPAGVGVDELISPALLARYSSIIGGCATTAAGAAPAPMLQYYLPGPDASSSSSSMPGDASYHWDLFGNNHHYLNQ